MRTQIMKYLLGILLIMITLVGSLWLAACQRCGNNVTGLLQGSVTIGPITPVEIPGENPPVSPEVFTSRKIMVYDVSGKTLVSEVSIRQIDQSATGYYTAQLVPGTYTVNIKQNGMDRSGEVPKQITISANQTVTLDINIDTGIR